ncbi:NAD(P)H-binding protein, PF13460 family [Leptospira broomii serovar Hurstbridge str. 5399]|uniref:NAD(P)H-binding protein, PF13460 family n=1 Tax=Leptospira broomii serovar Hurstbridge str. 5399 TaxID=1049789 RepID=T0GNM2_9LEPT|nr:NmrA family NAD(P)-binding protein [Leptospira broomii]EQA46928.1 NAD(P)H-binding protein, PF13460 family [Leptospira broomii serovar Hurstbridge str. 5399]
MKIFVYGGTGLVSGFIVDLLLASGHEVYAGTRNPLTGARKPNLHWVFADALQPDKGLEVLEKVDRAFFLSPPGYTDQYAILNPWLEKAKLRKLDKVVLMSAMGVEHAPPEAPFRKLEIAFENSGLPFTILRPNWFMQNFHTFWISGILKDKKIYFPGGEAKTSFIDARDIASSAVSALLNDSFNGKGIALTGREALTHREVADKISNATGLAVSYVDITAEDFKKGLLQAGLSEDYANFMVYIAGALKEGYSSPVLTSVKEMTGKDPIKFDEYALDNKAAWLN